MTNWKDKTETNKREERGDEVKNEVTYERKQCPQTVFIT